LARKQRRSAPINNRLLTGNHFNEKSAHPGNRIYNSALFKILIDTLKDIE